MRHFVFGRANGIHVQFFRYFWVGASSAVLDLVLFALFMQYANMHYLVAAFCAYMLGMIWNYTVGLLWVFESRHGKMKEMLMVFFIAIGGLFWTELLLWLGVEFGGFPPFWTKVVVLWIVLIWNFGMRKLFVFH